MTHARLRSFSLATTVVVLAILAAGCVQVVSNPSSGSPSPAPSLANEPTRDRVTSSDESNVARRARVRLELASAYYGRGQLTTALDEVKQALQADPNFGEAYNLRGLVYSGLGDYELAEESFRRAITLNPRDGDAFHNFGWHLCQRKRFREAAAQFAQALTAPQYLGTSRTLLASGVCESRSGNLEQAEATLKRAYDLDPGNPTIAVNLADVLMQRGDLERARFYVRRVNQTEELSNPQSLWLGARIEVRLGNQSGANDLGLRLRNRYPNSRESLAFDKGAFND